MSRPALKWVPTADVHAGDRLALLLSDAEAFPVITGWEDRELDLTRHDLGIVVHRVFTVTNPPWWALPQSRDSMLVNALDSQTLIVAREALPGMNDSGILRTVQPGN